VAWTSSIGRMRELETRRELALTESVAEEMPGT